MTKILSAIARRLLDLDQLEADIERLSHMWDLPDEDQP